jgi:serine/threonine protein kinase
VPHIINTSLNRAHIVKGKILRLPSKTRPALYLLEGVSGECIIKDYKAGDSKVRSLIGRILVQREKKAYERLGSMEGIPNFICAPDAFSICTALVPGKTVEAVLKNGGPPLSFYRDLRELTDALHRRGIVHCDLKRASNILLTPQGRPCILDFAAAIAKSETRFFPLTYLYRRLELDDAKAVTKFMLRSVPHLVDRAQAQAYLRRDRSERFLRVLRNRLICILKRLC